ncbi:hypothetical protein QFZ94_000308 [Paraburkholderia sp. JPY465]
MRRCTNLKTNVVIDTHSYQYQRTSGLMAIAWEQWS